MFRFSFAIIAFLFVQCIFLRCNFTSQVKITYTNDHNEWFEVAYNMYVTCKNVTKDC